MKPEELPPEEFRKELIKLLDKALNRTSYAKDEKRFLPTFIQMFQEWEEGRRKNKRPLKRDET